MKALFLSILSLLVLGFANPCGAVLVYDADFSPDVHGDEIGVDHSDGNVPPNGPFSVCRG